MDTLSRYRNLKHLTQEEWQALDIQMYIAANFNRYCSLLLKKIGYRHLPSDAPNTLPGLFCSIAYKPLSNVHARHLDAQGDRRNQIMLGTLKKIATTRMLDAIIEEFPSHISLDQLRVNGEFEEETQTQASNAVNENPPLFHGNAKLVSDREKEEEEDARSQQVSMMLEVLRDTFTGTQYQILRHVICDKLELTQIAALTGTSITNIRILLHHARKRMYDLLPPQVAREFEGCLHRR